MNLHIYENKIDVASVNIHGICIVFFDRLGVEFTTQFSRETLKYRSDLQTTAVVIVTE